MKTYPKMKDSGIEWIGKIPEHWSILKIKRISTKITKGTTPTTIGNEFAESGINFIRVENITELQIIDITNGLFIDSKTHSILGRSKLKEDDILVSIAGAIGRSAKVTKEILPANTNQAIAIISIARKITPDWIIHCLSAPYVQHYFDSLTVKSAQANLSLEDLGNTSIIYPPNIKEQEKIIDNLDKETLSIDSIMSKIESEIEKLQEFRQSLITSTVTGKIDVRQEIVA